MACLTLAEVRNLAVSLFDKIPEHGELERFIHFGQTEADCMPYVDIDDKGYHIKCFERGCQIGDDITEDLNELLYWIFSSVTSSIAAEYELKNRIKYQDNRRLMFSKQLELLEKIDTDFILKCRSEIHAILKDHPYDDANSTKLDLIDDFESMLEKVDAQPSLKSTISENCAEKIAAGIAMIRQLHKTGTNNLDRFLFDLFTSCRSIYFELGKVNKTIVGMEEIKNGFREKFLIAESVLDIARIN